MRQINLSFSVNQLSPLLRTPAFKSLKCYCSFRSGWLIQVRAGVYRSMTSGHKRPRGCGECSQPGVELCCSAVGSVPMFPVKIPAVSKETKDPKSRWMCPCHQHWNTDTSHIPLWLVQRIEGGVHLEPAAFIFSRLNEAHCNQQKTIHFPKRPCLWKDGVQGHRWRKFSCC